MEFYMGQCGHHTVVPVSRLKPGDFSEKSVAGAEQMQQEATIS